MAHKQAALVLVAALAMAASLTAVTPWQAAAPQQPATAERQLEAAIHREQVLGDVNGAIEQYKVLAQSATRTVAAQALVHLGQCYEKLGQTQSREARATYERVVRDYADQTEIVARARVRLAALGAPAGGAGLIVRRILDDASAIGGTLSPDGRSIRTLDRETGDVVAFELASGQTTRIANRFPWAGTEKTLEDEAFSRDGRQVAYNAETRADGKNWTFPLRIRNLDGSGTKTLCDGPDYVQPLDWSPDGSAILALRERGSAMELVRVSTADGSARVLLSDPGGWGSSQRARFSPDGRFVAVSLVRDAGTTRSDVVVLSAGGGNTTVVAGHPAEDLLLAWTPDGSALVFLSDRSGTWDIWRVRVAAGKQQGAPELLKRDFGGDSDVLGLAPDGVLYYKTQTFTGHLFTGALDLESGRVVGPPQPVTTRYTSPPVQPTWSPDGKSLAYISRWGTIGPNGNMLTIRSMATGDERFLSPRLRHVDQISWAPDGRSIIAVGYTATAAGIYRIDVASSAVSKLADGGLNPRLCPDGKTLLVFRDGVITRRNLETGEQADVTPIQGLPYDLSPDGSEVIFQGDGAVRAVSLSGGAPREIFKGKAAEYRWTRDGRYAYIRAAGSLWRVPAQGGAPTKLDVSFPRMMFVTLHPDSRQFLYMVIDERKTDLWAMENLLPPASRQ